MAAGFTLEKKNLNEFEKLINKDFIKNTYPIKNVHNYDAEISSVAINNDLYNDINKIGPFGNGNPAPIFFVKELKVIKSSIIDNKHIACILKSKIGTSINAISFDSFKTKHGEYLLNYKKYFNLVGQINENFWNNKKTLQLIIKDLILWFIRLDK